MSLCPILAYKVELYLIDLRYYNGVITTTAYSPTGLWDTYPFCKFNPSLTGHTKNRMFCRKLITNLIMDSYIWSSLCPYKEIYRPHGIIYFVSFFSFFIFFFYMVDEPTTLLLLLFRPFFHFGGRALQFSKLV